MEGERFNKQSESPVPQKREERTERENENEPGREMIKIQ